MPGSVVGLFGEGISVQDLERNKANVVAFHLMMFNECRPDEAVERYGRIVEHWDVLQVVPQQAAHPNGMF
jgi:hypothetical protein